MPKAQEYFQEFAGEMKDARQALLACAASILKFDEIMRARASQINVKDADAVEMTCTRAFNGLQGVSALLAELENKAEWAGNE